MIHFAPASVLLSLLSVSSWVRHESQKVLYRDIQLSTRAQITKFAVIAPQVGHHVRSLVIPEATMRATEDIRIILSWVRLLERLVVGHSNHQWNNWDCLPTHPTFSLKSLTIRPSHAIQHSAITPFLRTQCKSLVQLEIPSSLNYIESTSVFPQLRVLYTLSDNIWPILRQGNVICFRGSVQSPPLGTVLPSIRALQDHLMYSSTLPTLSKLLPEVRFVQVAFMVSWIIVLLVYTSSS